MSDIDIDIDNLIGHSQLIDNYRHQQQICNIREEQQEDREVVRRLLVDAQQAIHQLEVVEVVDYRLAVLQLPGHRAAVLVRDAQQAVATNL